MLTKLQANLLFLGGIAGLVGIFLVLWLDARPDGPKQTSAPDITPAVAAGKKIWDDNHCFGCHTLVGEGTTDAPKLNGTVERRGRNWIKTFLLNPEAVFPGPRKMAKYEFTEGQIDSIIAYLEWCDQMDAIPGSPAVAPLSKEE